MPQTWRLSELPRLIQNAEGFPEVLAALEAGHSATIDGAWGSSCALVAAGLAERVPRTLFVVASHVSDVDDLCEDIATFLKQEGVGSLLPESRRAGTGCFAQQTPVPFFPAWERLPREELVADEIYGQRLRLLKSLSADVPPRVVVTSIQALLQPVPSPDWVLRHSRRLQVGDTVPLDDLLRWLIDCGFVRRDAVDLPGEISLRGGILDVFPPDLTAPVRIEYSGDEIESIRAFDIDTQRSIEQFSELSLMAAQPSTGAAKGAAKGVRNLFAKKVPDTFSAAP